MKRNKPVPAAAAVVCLLVAACGGSATSNSPSAVAYSSCMRSHGVPNFPDPSGSTQIPKTDPRQLGVSSSQLETARRACRHLTPTSGETEEQQQETQCAMADDCSQAVAQQWLSGLRTLASCLRSHGVPNWPDPIIGPQGNPHYPYEQAGIDHHSPSILAKVDACVRITGFQGLPLP